MNPKLPLLLCLLAAVAYYWSTRPRTITRTQQSIASKSESSASQIPLSKLTPAPSVEANAIIAQAASALVQGEPLHAKARFCIDLLDQQFAAPGEYWQQGQGTRKSRLEFSYQQNDDRLHVFQVCDGRCFYWYRTFNDDAHLEYVDLQQIEESESDSEQAPLVSGGQAWNSVGGLSSMLEHIANTFHFEPVQQAMLDEMPVYLVRGRWKAESLARLMEGQVEPEKLARDDWWKFLPRHLPHEVRLILGADRPFQLFPYRIEFLQYEQDGNRVASRSVVSLELYEVESKTEIADAFFQVAAVRSSPIDLTEFYIDRVKQFTRR
jgi:hypothetical protein